MPIGFPSRWIALPLVIAGSLVPAASAQAAFGISGAVAQPSNTQAGAHSNFSLSYDTTGDEDIRNLVTELPPGLVGNPTAVSYCNTAELADDPGVQCADAIVGTASSTVEAAGLPLPLTASGNVYNMVPQGNDPATLGIRLESPGNLTAPVILIGHASARTTDFGLNTTILDIPNTASIVLLGTVPIHITHTELTLNASFMTNPTSCAPATTRITGTSYDGTTASDTASFTPTNCLGQAYNPQFALSVDLSKGPDHINNPEIVTRVTQGINEANGKRVEAILPSTIQANNAALNVQCPEANFLASTCSPGAQVGTAVARTPLLTAPLEGPVFLIQNVGVLPRLGLDLRGPLPAKLFGNVTPTQTFRLDNVFDGLPDVPLTDFKLTFRGGKTGLTTATKGLCGKEPDTFDAIFDSHGGHHVTRSGQAKLIGCGLVNNRCKGKKLTDVGGKGANTIRGTKKRDVINGLGGRDRIVGLKGNDVLCGGKGRDKISGGPGKDKLSGGAGRDLLLGGAGADKLAGGPGKDRQKQ